MKMSVGLDMGCGLSLLVVLQPWKDLGIVYGLGCGDCKILIQCEMGVGFIVRTGTDGKCDRLRSPQSKTG